jgi:Flp pilus assembly protein, ATPase CpaF
MLRRLETMILMGVELPLEAIRRQIASGIDLLVHLGRLRDRTRKVLEIIEIVGFKDGEILTSSIFSYEEDIKESSNTVVHGELKRVGRLSHIEKIVMAGIKEEEINGL